MCKNPGKYRYTWPGRDEAVICDDHAGKLKAIADAIGLHLQFIPLSEEDLEVGITCMQK